MKRILHDLFSLFFPNTCVGCKRPLIRGEEKICVACLSRLPYMRFGSSGNPVAQLFAGSNEIGFTHAFLRYEKGGITQRLVFSLKYYGNKQLGFILGRMAALEVMQSKEFNVPDLIIPVPLHPARLRQRGYNQSEWIARGFNSVCGTRIDTTSLRRVKKTDTQTRKNVYNRIAGIETAFQLTSDQHIEGKHVLLVDDVITTGATINACIAELLRCKKVKISIFSLAVAQ